MYFRKNSNQCRVLTLLAGTVLSFSLSAQSVDPGQIEQSLDKSIELALPPPPVMPPNPTLARPEQADSVFFVLKAVVVTGSNQIPGSELLPLYEEDLGTEVSLESVYAIADAVTAAYRNAGYVLSQAVIPAQKIDDGVVEIQVVEGFVSETEYNPTGFSGSGALDALSSDLTKEKPMILSTFERKMLLMNDLPGVDASATIGPSDTGGLGAARVLVTVGHDPFSGSVSLNNRGSDSTGPGRLEFDASRNLTAAGHMSIGASGVIALDGSTLGVGSGFIDVGLGARGTSRLRLTASLVQAQPDYGFAVFNDFESESTRLGVMFSRPLVRSRQKNFYFGLGLEAYDATSQGQRASDGTLGTDTATSLRTLSLSFTFDEVKESRVVSQFEMKLKKGIDGLGAEDKRLSATEDVDFLKMELSMLRLQRLGSRFSLLTALDAQWSLSGGLPSSEVYGIGGQNFVRAYDSSESSADSGVALKTELRFDAGSLGRSGLRLVPYGYFDYGLLDKKSASGVQDLSAAGAGVRFSRGGLGGYLEVGVPLDGVVSEEGTDNPRVFGGISYSF